MTDFGGRAGLMLSRTTFVTATVTGLILVAAVAAVSALSDYTPAIIPGILMQFVVSYFIAHFAMEGYSDEWSRAGRAIPPQQVSMVALRYMAMSTVLYLPILLQQSWTEVAGSMVVPDTTAVLYLVYLLLCLIAPPALLVVSVSADSWGDLASGEHWRSRFSGRGDDFFLIYVIFMGGLFCMTLLGIPVVALAGTISTDESPVNTEMMQWAGGAVLVFAMGFSISLLGRLCGSFAVVAPAAAPTVATAQPAALHPLLTKLQPGDLAKPAAEASGAPARKTALVDASTRVEALRDQHRGDAAALVASLRELEAAHLPHPAVSQALVLALIAAGRADEAGTAANDAITVCLRSGNVTAAAVIYEALLTAGTSIDLGKDQLISIGESLKSTRRADAALEVYGRVLKLDQNEMRAIKGTIAIARDLALKKETAMQAVQVYDDLIVSCPGTTLMEFIKTERAKASKRAADQ